MVEREMESVDCNTNGGNSSEIPWSYESNWIIAHGSLEFSITVESSDDPIAEPDPENTATTWPLILKPRGDDSGPCEIKICFKQKYEVGQIYVRSTARAYEIYYATSPHGINEYLSTVRCGVAVRDDKILKTSCVEDAAEERGECLSGYLTAETASNGGSTATSEDDWVKIKVPGAGSSPASDKTSTNGSNNIQDLYEATAQISDSDPCMSLTIRLLSLQDSGHVYVDEIYVFMDHVESTDSGNGAVLAGSSAQSSLMAMFMPTLLQLSKSGVSRAQDLSDEVLKNNKMESAPTIIDKIDSPQQIVKPKELCKDTTESAEHQKHTSAKKCGEEKNANGFQPSRLETAMEQLVSRLSRVEDICLRFEEKMLGPIERIEARLQQVENQLEKLAKISHDFGLPHCTRISAPAFSCSESNSSSFYNDELEKKNFACDNIGDLSVEAHFNPGLIIRAPEFSYGEDDEDNDDSKPEILNPCLMISAPELFLDDLEDSPHVEPKKTLSVDDALAAALNGFMSAAVNTSKPIGILGDVNEEIQYQGHAKPCQIETEESPAAENDNTEYSQFPQVRTITAPDFTVDEAGSEEQSNFVQSSLDVASVTEHEENDHDNEKDPPSIDSAGSCDFGRKESTDEFGSASNGDSSAASVMASRMCLGNGLLNGCSKVNVIESYFEGDASCGPAEISNASAPNSAKDLTDTSMHQIPDETNLEKLSSKPDDQDSASEEVVGHEAEIVSEDLQQNVAVGSSEDDAECISDPSNVACLDFEFPILEVKFTSDVHVSSKSALEALLYDESAESNTEAPSVNTNGINDCNAKEIDAVSANGNETSDVLLANGLLLDVGISAADSSHLEGSSHSLCPPSSAEMGVSLI